MEQGYPKWVQREPHIGAVLAQSSKEEKQILDDWEAEKLKAAEEVTAKAKAEAKEAEEAAQLVLKQQGGKAGK